MKVPYREGVANHSGPESCAAAREGGREALTGERVGQLLNSENSDVQGADGLGLVGRQHHRHRLREVPVDPAESKNLCTHGSLLRGSREIPEPAMSDGTTVRVGNPKGAHPR